MSIGLGILGERDAYLMADTYLTPERSLRALAEPQTRFRIEDHVLKVHIVRNDLAVCLSGPFIRALQIRRVLVPEEFWCLVPFRSYPQVAVRAPVDNL